MAHLYKLNPLVVVVDRAAALRGMRAANGGR
jgi:hypothetical protein